MLREIPDKSFLGEILKEGFAIVALWCVAAFLVLLWPIAKILSVIYGSPRPRSKQTEFRHTADDREIYVGLVLRALNYGSRRKWEVGRLLHGVAQACETARAKRTGDTPDSYGDYPEYAATTAADVFGGHTIVAGADCPLQGNGRDSTD